MAHAEVLLPQTVAVGFESDEGFNVDIVRTFNQHEYRNLNQEDAVIEYRATFPGKTRAQNDELRHFYRARGGPAQSFNFKDHFDYEASLSEGVFTALGSSTFQMWKRYSSTGTRDRKILKLLASSLVVKAGAVTLTVTSEYTVDATTGIVTTIGSPTVTPTSWSGTFYVPVRFVGRAPQHAIDGSLFSWNGLSMIEVLNP